jgi:Flp pilus assembly protein TadD
MDGDMSESTQQNTPAALEPGLNGSQEELAKTMGEFARRVVNGERTADLFGIGDNFINDVLNRAYRFYTSKSFDRAEVLLRGAIALDETRAYPHLLLGDIMLQQSQFAEALAVLERAAELEPKDGEILAKLGEARLRVGRIDEAVESLAHAMDGLAHDSRHYKRAGVLLEVARRSSRESEAAERA